MARARQCEHFLAVKKVMWAGDEEEVAKYNSHSAALVGWRAKIQFGDRLDVWVDHDSVIPWACLSTRCKSCKKGRVRKGCAGEWCVGRVIELRRWDALFEFENLHVVKAEFIGLKSDRIAPLYSKTRFWRPVYAKKTYSETRKWAKKWRWIQVLKRKRAPTPDEREKISKEREIEGVLDKLQAEELAWRNDLKTGDHIDVLDCYSKWYSATIIEVDIQNDMVQVHYDGYKLKRWDEYVGRRSCRIAQNFQFSSGGRESGGKFQRSEYAFPMVRSEIFNDPLSKSDHRSSSPVISLSPMVNNSNGSLDTRGQCVATALKLTTLRHLGIHRALDLKQQQLLAQGLNKSHLTMLTISTSFCDEMWTKLCAQIAVNKRLKVFRAKLMLGVLERNVKGVSEKQYHILCDALRKNTSILHLVYDVLYSEEVPLNPEDILRENIYIRTLNLVQVSRNWDFARWVAQRDVKCLCEARVVLAKTIIDCLSGVLYVPLSVAEIILECIITDRGMDNGECQEKWPELPRWFSFGFSAHDLGL